MVKCAGDAGATVTMAPHDMFWAPWGMRYGRLKDRFGHAWAFGAPLPANSENTA